MRRAWLVLALAATAAADTSAPRSWRLYEPFDHLRGWETAAGDWKLDNGALVGRSGDAADLCASLKFKRRIAATELEVEATALQLSPRAGLQIQFAGQKFYHYGGVSGIWPPYVTTDAGLPADRTIRIRLRRTADGFEFAVDGKVIVSKKGAPSTDFPADEIVLWATYGATIRYDNLRVR